MSTDHKKSSGSKKGLSAFEKAFAAARKKAGGPDGIFTFKVDGKDKKFTTAYEGEKTSKKAKEKKKENKAVNSGVSIKDLEPLGESKTMKEFLDAKQRVRDKANKGKGTITVTMMALGVDDKDKAPSGRLPAKVPAKPSLRIHVNALENQRARKEWDKMYGKFYKADGTLKKGAKTSNVSPGSKARKESRDKAKGLNVGGLTQSPMMNGLSRKINPATGLTMKKGGMVDYRKKGMFYGGGMARRGR